MDLAEHQNHIAEIVAINETGNTDTYNDAALFALTARSIELQNQIHGTVMRLQVEADDRRTYRSSKYRSMSTALAKDLRMNRRTVGRIINQAHIMLERLPKIHSAYLQGLISRDQLDLLARVADIPKFTKIVGEYQDYFLSFAHEQYPWFRYKVEAWMVEVDPTDPQDADEKAHLDRRMIWSEGFGNTVLAELNLPVVEFEQLMSVLRPIYDTLLKQEWKQAKLDAGLDPEDCDDQAATLCFKDLARTDKQRWVDALMISVRAAGAMTATAVAKIAAGEELSVSDLDPGALAQVVIVADQTTIEREIQRQNGEELEPRSEESLAKRRCETLSGRLVSPSTALELLGVGSFRRMLMAPNNVDFTMSRLSRFFAGPLRLGLMIRDRHCTGDGCDAGIERCEADHLTRHTNGGLTSSGNGRMRCGPCHRHKTWLESMGLWQDPNKPSRSDPLTGDDPPDVLDLWSGTDGPDRDWPGVSGGLGEVEGLAELQEILELEARLGFDQLASNSD